VIMAHIMGIPAEESVLQLAPAGAMALTAAMVLVRLGFSRITRVRRRKAE
jgi:hypothetical protein